MNPAGLIATGSTSQVKPVAMRQLGWLTWIPVCIASGLIIFSLVDPTSVAQLSLPIAILGALIGVPHGAVDHLISSWWTAPDQGKGGGRWVTIISQNSRRRMAGFVAGYVAVAAVVLALLLLVPGPMLVLALLLSALHFGRGEVVTSAERAGRAVPGTLRQWPITIAYGGVTVGLLLWSRPALSDPYLRPLSAGLADVAWRTHRVGLLLVGVFVVVALSMLCTGRRWLEAAELSLLAVMFSVAPPLAAFGVYFGGWHALRHTGRLLDLAGQHLLVNQRMSYVRWSDCWLTLFKASMAPVCLALLTMGGLFLVSDFGSVQAEIAVLLALTFPHAAVVWMLDRNTARLDAASPTLTVRSR